MWPDLTTSFLFYLSSSDPDATWANKEKGLAKAPGPVEFVIPGADPGCLWAHHVTMNDTGGVGLAAHYGAGVVEAAAAGFGGSFPLTARERKNPTFRVPLVYR